MRKVLILAMVLIISISVYAQEEEKSTGVITFLLKPQRDFRLERPIYVGFNSQGFLAGYHFHKNFTFNVAYTPRNYFDSDNGLEVGGISEGLGFTDGADDNEIFQITGVDDYENIDRNLTMIDIRYFPISGFSFFLSAGYGLATHSERSVFFSSATRIIGNNEYKDLGIDVRVLMKNAHSFNIGTGIHHFFGPVGIGFSGHWGLNPRRIDKAEITASETLDAADLVTLGRIIQSEVETEHFGFYQMLFTLSFNLNFLK